MERFVCIHGHFYQPPRENAWLESIELQDSARPYHDWNERVTAECYAPNSASRILDDKLRIEHIVSNYSRMSFNFGPTLLSWMEGYAPETYRAILDSDKESQRLFSGHGSAMAQAYNHVIMPLANARDKRTQVLWGLQDFKRRFGRDPEGMWLPETAVDLETLDIMAEVGVKFTVLAPGQAARVRPIGGNDWQDAGNGRLDPNMPYLLHLPSGNSIALYFYNGDLAHGVAFGGLLNSGDEFYQRLMTGFNNSEAPQLVHIATDGETYGHHHRFGDMALAYAIHKIQEEQGVRLTNYGEYLEKHPPRQEVQIFERSSWSCAHGVERWRADCGCNTGGHHGWNQAWRAPLRNALDWLRDNVVPRYEEAARRYLKDPWSARDDYISVILDRSRPNMEAFLQKHATGHLHERDLVATLKLLELQRNTMLMFTSCGWFFDELSGIETVQVIQYAGRALQLAREAIGDGIEDQFVSMLEQARSNIPEQGNGRSIYEKYVRPAVIDLRRVAAHYALSSLFRKETGPSRLYSYEAELQDYRPFESWAARLAAGKVKIISDVTLASATMYFCVVYLGGHNLHGGVQEFQDEAQYQSTVRKISGSFQQGDLPLMMRQLDSNFSPPLYSLSTLFRDEQRSILDSILEPRIAETENKYRQVYDSNYDLMRFLTRLGYPLPASFHFAADLVVNADLRKWLTKEPLSITAVEALLEQAKLWNIHYDKEGLGHMLANMLEKMMNSVESEPGNLSGLQAIEEAVKLTAPGRFEVNLWKVQNNYYRILLAVYPEYLKRARAGDASAGEWSKRFAALGESFSVKVKDTIQ